METYDVIANQPVVIDNVSVIYLHKKYAFITTVNCKSNHTTAVCDHLFNYYLDFLH